MRAWTSSHGMDKGHQRCGQWLSLSAMWSVLWLGSVFSLLCTTATAAPERVAVCIGGQLSRWQPVHLFQGLLLAESNLEHFEFHLFFNLQIDNQTVYNTDTQYIFASSSMYRMTEEEMRLILNAFIRNSTRSWPVDRQSSVPRIASMQFHRSLTTAELQRLTRTMPLSSSSSSLQRIAQFVGSAQATILNMYAHQERCALQIQAYERRALHGQTFDYVISTREDVLFFKEMHLSALSSQLRQIDDDTRRQNGGSSSSSTVNASWMAEKARILDSTRVPPPAEHDQQSSFSTKDDVDKAQSQSQSQSQSQRDVALNDLLRLWNMSVVFRPEHRSNRSLDIAQSNSHSQLSIDSHSLRRESEKLPIAIATQTAAVDPSARCDIFSKRCLNFWGLNMRLLFLRRDTALSLIGNRFSFYHWLDQLNVTIENPERFELLMVNALRLESCAMPVDQFAVTASRLFAASTLANAIKGRGQRWPSLHQHDRKPKTSTAPVRAVAAARETNSSSATAPTTTADSQSSWQPEDRTEYGRTHSVQSTSHSVHSRAVASRLLLENSTPHHRRDGGAPLATGNNALPSADHQSRLSSSLVHTLSSAQLIQQLHKSAEIPAAATQNLRHQQQQEQQKEEEEDLVEFLATRTPSDPVQHSVSLSSVLSPHLQHFAQMGLQDDFCFIWFEIDRCVPLSNQPLARERLCLQRHRQQLLSQWTVRYGADHPQLQRLTVTAQQELQSLPLTETARKPLLIYRHNETVSLFRAVVRDSTGISKSTGNGIGKKPKKLITVPIPGNYTGVPVNKVIGFLKSKRKSTYLLRVMLDKQFVETYWTERDFA